MRQGADRRERSTDAGRWGPDAAVPSGSGGPLLAMRPEWSRAARVRLSTDGRRSGAGRGADGIMTSRPSGRRPSGRRTVSSAAPSEHWEKHVTDQDSRPRFCAQCGAPRTTDARFCGGCGTAFSLSAPPAAQPTTTQPVWSQPPGEPAPTPVAGSGPEPAQGPTSSAEPGQPAASRRRRVLPVLVGVVVLVVVAAGALGARHLLGGARGGTVAAAYGGVRDLPEAPSDEPSRDWTYRPGSGSSISNVLDGPGGGAFVTVFDEDSGDDDSYVGRLVRVDASGEEDWSVDVDGGCDPIHLDDVLVCQTYSEDEEGSVRGLDPDDGTQLWEEADAYLASVSGSTGFVVGGGTLRSLDLGSGETRWSVDADTASVGEQAAYVISGSTLSRVDVSSGDEEWSAGVDTPEDEESSSVAGNDALVAVVGTSEVRVLDASDGTEMETIDSDSASVLPLADGLLVSTSTYSDETEESETTLHLVGPDGTTTETDIGDDSEPDVVVTSGSGQLLVSTNGGGEVYDAELERVVRLPDVTEDGFVYPVVDGFLVVTSEEVSLLDLEGKDRWSVDVGDGWARAAGGALLVVSEDSDELTRWS